VVEGQCARAWELYESYPEHPALTRLLFARWMNFLNYYEDPRRVLDEGPKMLARQPSDALEHELRMVLADASSRTEEVPFDGARARIDYVVDHARASDVKGWGIAIVQRFASERTADPQLQGSLFRRAAGLAKRLGEPYQTASVERVLARLGRDLALGFDDALGATRWSPSGRPVVVQITYLDSWEVQEEGRHEELEELLRLRPRLREAGVELVTVNRAFAASQPAAGIERARSAGVDWPLWNDTAELEAQWAWRLGVNEPETYLLLDGEGRLEAACRRARPIVERALALRERH
jgi:hypothetical protein